MYAGQRPRRQPLPVEDSGDLSWKRGLQVPNDRTQALLLQAAQATPVSTFDSTLPPVPIADWLFLALAPHVQVERPQSSFWSVTFCDDLRAAAPGPGPELCAEATYHVTADRDLRLHIVVATAVRNLPTGRVAWQPVAPSLRDVYFERADEAPPRDSLDVPTLSKITDLVNVPTIDWPGADFTSAVSWEPVRPAPGETVRFHIRVRNTGRRSVDRALVDILIAPCCDNVEWRRTWFPHLAVDEEAGLDWDVPLPQGMATAVVSVRVAPQGRPVRDANPNREATVVQVGYRR